MSPVFGPAVMEIAGRWCFGQRFRRVSANNRRIGTFGRSEVWNCVVQHHLDESTPKKYFVGLNWWTKGSSANMARNFRQKSIILTWRN